MSTPTAQLDRLSELEQIVIGYRKELEEVATALVHIKNEKLYELRGFKSFKEYCEKHLNLSRSYGYRLADYGEAVLESVANGDAKPASEFAVRKAKAAKRNPAPPTTAADEFAAALGHSSVESAIEAVKVSPQSKLPKPLLDSLDLALESIRLVMDADFNPDCESMKQIAKDVRKAASELDRFAKTVCEYQPRGIRMNLDQNQTKAWISVEENLPADGQRVICKYEGVYSPRLVTFWSDDANAHFGLPNEPDGKGSQPATHWMPLP